MKKLIAMAMVATVLVTSAPLAQAEGEGRGGPMGFIAGCCFGLRTAADYNDGKEVHWREWCMLIPYVNVVFAVWNGVDGASGVTNAELAERYGSTYF